MTRPLEFDQRAPVGWRRTRLKDLASHVDRGVAPDYADHDTGVVAFNQKCITPDLSIAPELGRPVAEGSVPVTSPARLRAGDIVVNSTGRGTLGRAAHVRRDPVTPLIADGHVTLIRLRRDGADPRFMYYVLATDAFYQQANVCLAVGATNQTELNREALRRMSVLLPPTLDEQRRIADYLDAETARIDDLIAEQELQMRLVEERFRAWLLQVVTRGTGNQPTRVSSDLGGLSVSRSWEVRRLGTLDCEIQTGPFGSQLHQKDYIENGYPVVNPANLISGRIVPTPEMTVDLDTRNRLSRHVLEVGDIVFGRRGEMGRAGLVTDLEAGWLCGTGSLRIRFRKQHFDLGYLQRLLGSSLIKQYLEAVAIGATMDNLNSSIVARIPIPLPPFDEQQQLAGALGVSRVESDRLITELSHAVDLLRERRQALITTAVTQGVDGLPGVA